MFHPSWWLSLEPLSPGIEIEDRPQALAALKRFAEGDSSAQQWRLPVENRQIQLNLNTCRSNLPSVFHICFALSRVYLFQRSLMVAARRSIGGAANCFPRIRIGRVTMIMLLIGSRRKCRKCSRRWHTLQSLLYSVHPHFVDDRHLSDIRARAT